MGNKHKLRELLAQIAPEPQAMVLNNKYLERITNALETIAEALTGKPMPVKTDAKEEQAKPEEQSKQEGPISFREYLGDADWTKGWAHSDITGQGMVFFKPTHTEVKAIGDKVQEVSTTDKRAKEKTACDQILANKEAYMKSFVGDTDPANKEQYEAKLAEFTKFIAFIEERKSHLGMYSG